MSVWSNLRFLAGGKKSLPAPGGSKAFVINADPQEDGWHINPVSYPMFGRLNAKEELVENDFTEYVRKAYKSDGVVFACMLARQMVFTEARFQYQRLEKGRPTDLWGDGSLSLLETPWVNGCTGDLLSRAIQDVDLAGNHYVVKQGDRLRRLRPDWVRIILSDDPNTAADVDVVGYLYEPGGYGAKARGGGSVLYSVKEVAHWAPIPDPEAQYRGMSWLTPVLRETMGDKAATLHKLKYFENAATPNLAVALKETVTKEQFEEFIEAMDAGHKGVEQAYKTLYLGGGADVTVVGADMRAMDFKSIQGAGETRIAAAARVHPVIVGLSEGMQGSSLNSGNFKAAKDGFGDGTLRPLWRGVAAAYAKLVKVPAGSRLWYDDRDIQFLRADLNERAEVAQRDASIIRQLTDGGWKPDSIKAALKAGYDWDKLVHSGLVSVQLLPPGTTSSPSTPSNLGDSGGGGTQPGRRPGGRTPNGPPTSGGGGATPKPPSST